MIIASSSSVRTAVEDESGKWSGKSSCLHCSMTTLLFQGDVRSDIAINQIQWQREWLPKRIRLIKCQHRCPSLFFFIVCPCSFDTSRCWKSFDFSIFSLRFVSVVFFLFFWQWYDLCRTSREELCVQQIDWLTDCWMKREAISSRFWLAFRGNEKSQSNYSFARQTTISSHLQ